jgi:hypothetical protein
MEKSWLKALLLVLATFAPLALSWAQGPDIPQRQYVVNVTHSLERLPDGRAQRGLATIVITDGATSQVVKRFVVAYPTTFGPDEIAKVVSTAVHDAMLTVPEPPGPLAPPSTYTIVK